jgi:formylglycine-generating enzyme required for sulfatase activity
MQAKIHPGAFAPHRKMRICISAVVAAAALMGSAIDPNGVRAAGPLPGDKRINPRDGLAYIWTGKGEFTMGCSEADPVACTDLEKPAHRVTISKGVWIGQTEVTQKAYKLVTGKNPSRFEGDRLPVENLMWEFAALPNDRSLSFSRRISSAALLTL